tara:strand:+ start:1473 stop:2780 length:1308 start_codon:yes stop_codon:yes gene_type:complete
MTDLEIGFATVGAMLVLMALRFPIGLSLGLVSVAGVWAIRGPDAAFAMISAAPFEVAAKWELSAIPMFILMGTLAHHSGLSAALFKAARLWLGGLPGGLAVATNFACAGFAAASGASTATAAAMGRITVPEMLKYGYDKGLATGVVAAGGTLGIMIPPSIGFVLYGIFAQVSISKLLIAGILPGLLTATVYALMIMVRCRLKPSLAPPVSEDTDWGERFRAVAEIWPLLFLVLAVIGGIYAGVTTPTEAGAVGAFIAFVIGAVQGRMSRKVFWGAVTEAVSTTARLFFIVVGAVLFSRLLALAGVAPFLAESVEGWSADPILLVIGASVLFIVLGMFLDALGLMLLTLPILLPMFMAADLDLIWFGVLTIKFIEIGLITPPVGLNVYVIRSVVGETVPLETIFRGVMWFIACEAVIAFLLIAFPQISLFLPGLMG